MKKVRVKYIFVLCIMLVGMLCLEVMFRGTTAYAYTEEEKQQAKSWLSSHGYAPTRAGAEQAYQDYLDGKLSLGGSSEGEEPDDDIEDIVTIGGEEPEERSDGKKSPKSETGQTGESELDKEAPGADRIIRWIPAEGQPQTDRWEELAEAVGGSSEPEPQPQQKAAAQTEQESDISDPDIREEEQSDADTDTEEERGSYKLAGIIAVLLAVLVSVFGWDFWHQRKREKNRDED